MLDKVQQIAAYLCMNYPHKDELSNARITKMIYLADWFSALLQNKQMTNVEWIFNHYGPYVDDIINSLKNADDFSIKQTQTLFGNYKYQVCYNGSASNIELNDDERKILDFVIDKTKGLFFNAFINYVYATYPIATHERYSKLNLIQLAKKYKSEQTACS